MSEELVRQIASEIANHTILNSIWLYVLLVVLTALASLAGAFLASYMRRRGENFATKADFNELLRQMKATTEITETTQNEIRGAYSDRASIKAILREKLERMIEASYAIDEWVRECTSVGFRGKFAWTVSNPISKVLMYQALYFPELAKEAEELRQQSITFEKWTVELSRENAKAKADGRPVDLSSLPMPIGPLVDANKAFQQRAVDLYSDKLGLRLTKV